MRPVDRVELLYRSGEVRRLHTVEVVRRHDIARHVYGSLLIAVELCDLNGVPSRGVMRTLLYHDAPEVLTGDTPAPVKRQSPAIDRELKSMEEVFYAEAKIEMPQLDALQGRIVTCSDVLDLCFNCLHERRAGNRTRAIQTVFERALSYLDEHQDVVGVSHFTVHLRKEWDHV